MKPAGLYFFFFFVWTTGLLIFITAQLRDNNTLPQPTIKYEVTEAQKEAQKNLEKEIETLERKNKDLNAKLDSAVFEYSQLKIEVENSEKKKRR